MHGESGRAEQLDKQVSAFLFEDARGLEQTQIFLARQLGLLGLGQGCGHDLPAAPPAEGEQAVRGGDRAVDGARTVALLAQRLGPSAHRVMAQPASGQKAAQLAEAVAVAFQRFLGAAAALQIGQKGFGQGIVEQNDVLRDSCHYVHAPLC